MENCMFPMEFLRVTQRPGIGSHRGSKAIDFGGRDTGKDKVYAPFSGTVVRTRKGANGELYLVSDAPVRFADGTSDYCTVTFIHDEAFNVPEGAHVVQGQYIYDEGGMGSGRPHKFGNHLHMEVSRGKVSARQVANIYGVYCTAIQMDINKAMMLGNDVTVMDAGGMEWHRRTECEAPAQAQNAYTVRAGDSWWRIAEQQLGSGTKLYKLAAANGKTVNSPLHPGDKLTLEV